MTRRMRREHDNQKNLVHMKTWPYPPIHTGTHQTEPKTIPQRMLPQAHLGPRASDQNQLGHRLDWGPSGMSCARTLLFLRCVVPSSWPKPSRGYYWGNAPHATPHPHFGLGQTLACSWPCFATKHWCATLSPIRTIDYDSGANIT